MKPTMPQPPIRRRRNEYLKGAHSQEGQGTIQHGHCHTRGELPGRLARNWKMNQGSTIPTMTTQV
jgi:hypothetical protein